jgi:hypothetical protein
MVLLVPVQEQVVRLTHRLVETEETEQMEMVLLSVVVVEQVETVLVLQVDKQAQQLLTRMEEMEETEKLRLVPIPLVVEVLEGLV